MPSFGGWMFLLDICCQLLEKIWTWRSFRWLTRRWPTLSTSRWLKSFVRLNFNPSHIDQWMRMSVSNSHRGQATSLWRQFPVIVKVKVWRHCSIFLALVTFILLEENGKPHHDFGERLLCLKTSSGHCENESVEEGLLHTFLQSHIGGIYLPIRHSVFSNVSLNCLPMRMHNYIGCILSTFLYCAFSNDP